jgi:P-type Cu2+ transporter
MAETLPCTHCGQSVTATSNNNAPVFCCAGCHAAHAIITGCGLADYYALRQSASAPATAPPGDAAISLAYSGEAFERAHVTKRSDGLSEIAWFVHGIHCTACLWLLEQLPVLDAGIRQARLAFSESRLAVIYDPTQTSPEKQAALLVRLGYPVRPFADDDSAGRAELRQLLLRVAIAGAATLGSMHLSVNLYAGEITQDLDAAGGQWFSLTALAVSAPAWGWSALPLYRAGFAALRLRRTTVDLTAAIIIFIGLVASVINFFSGSRETYVDALAMFIALLLSGRLAVLIARRRARAQLAGFGDLLPLTAVRAHDGQRVACAALNVGDEVQVLRGEIIPCDGTTRETIIIDAAVLNGESRPQTIGAGGMVYAGTTHLSDKSTLNVVATGAQTRLGGLMREAQRVGDRPSRFVAAVDAWQGWFMLVVAIIAAGVWAYWSWHGQPTLALAQAIAVILVSCPCALGLATPLVLAVACQRATAAGIILRDPSSLDILGQPSQIRHIVLDKTGTITEGRMRVAAWEWLGQRSETERARIMSMIVAAEIPSSHPIALSIVAHAAGITPSQINAREERHGFGIIAHSELGELCIGNSALTGMHLHGQTSDNHAQSHIGVTLNGVPVARVVCADPLRPGIRDDIAAWEKSGQRVHLLSGDDVTITRAVGQALGLDAARCVGGQSPEAKNAYISGLKKDGYVVMVGDGMNDAAALAQADVGIGLRGGIESAPTACRVAIIRHDALPALRKLFHGAHAAQQRIRQILLFSLAYNALGIFFAASGWWGPLICAIAMPLSSLTAVIMAARGKYFVAKKA